MATVLPYLIYAGKRWNVIKGLPYERVKDEFTTIRIACRAITELIAKKKGVWAEYEGFTPLDAAIRFQDESLLASIKKSDQLDQYIASQHLFDMANEQTEAPIHPLIQFFYIQSVQQIVDQITAKSKESPAGAYPTVRSRITEVMNFATTLLYKTASFTQSTKFPDYDDEKIENLKAALKLVKSLIKIGGDPMTKCIDGEPVGQVIKYFEKCDLSILRSKKTRDFVNAIVTPSNHEIDPEFKATLLKIWSHYQPSPESGSGESNKTYVGGDESSVSSATTHESDDFDLEPMTESPLSPNAKEFFPIAEKIRTVKAFIAGNRMIRGISDLPEFLQYQLDDIVTQNPGAYFVLKGSAFRPRKTSDTTTPTDLDIDIVIPGISEWKIDRVKSLIFELLPAFPGKLTNLQTQHKENNSEPVFSVNISDPVLMLDFSLYDGNKLPNPRTSWATSYDIKIVFKKEANTYKPQYLRPVSKPGFHINPDARHLIFRVCLAKIKFRLQKWHLLKAFEALSPYNPVDYFYVDLGLPNQASSNHDSIIRKKITQFCSKHQLQHEIQSQFIQNLYWVLTAYNNGYKNPQELEFYQSVYVTMKALVEFGLD